MAENLTLTDLETIPESEAVERFSIDRHLDCFNDGTWTGQPVRIHEGDLHLSGNLLLDPNSEWDDHQGLVVIGNLTVARNIVNEDIEGGAFLYVTGALKATNLIAGGACITVSGGAEIDELILAHYNDGVLHIGGETKAGLVISDDHATSITTSATVWNSHDTIVGMPLSEFLHADIPIETDPYDEDDDDSDVLTVDTFEPADIIAHIASGRSALRDPQDDRPRRSQGAWRRVVDAHWPTLENVPAEFIDAAMCRSAVGQHGWALQYVPEALRTPDICETAMRDDPDAYPFVPEALRTEEFSRMAVTEDGRHLTHVPTAHRTIDICAEAIRNDPFGHDALKATPDEMLGPDLYLLAVQANGRNLRLVPAEHKTRDICAAAVRGCPEAIEDVPDDLLTVLEKSVERDAQNVRDNGRIDAALDAATADDKLLDRSKTGLIADIVLAEPDTSSSRPGGPACWLTDRPVLLILLRAVISAFMLAVHLWLTVTVWGGHGLGPGIATFLGLFIAEFYWAWQFGFAGILPVLCVVSVVVYWTMELVMWRATRRWRDSGLLNGET